MFAQDPSMLVSLRDFFVTFIGDPPAELEPLIWIAGYGFILYVTGQFFTLLRSVFEVRRWRK